MTTRTPSDIHLTRRHPNTNSLIELWAVKPTSRIAIADIYCAEPGSEQEANAEFIVRAWNSFDGLLDAVRSALAAARVHRAGCPVDFELLEGEMLAALDAVKAAP